MSELNATHRHASRRLVAFAAAACAVVCWGSCTSYKLSLEPTSGTDGGGLDGGSGDGGYINDGGDGFVDDGGFAVCKDVGHHVALSPLELFILLDVSGSMDYDDKWIAVSAAMRSFINNPDFNDLGVALQYFPLRLQCDVGNYATPAVPFDLLPNNRGALAASIDQQRMQGGTPTVPALEGVVAYTQAFLAQRPDAGVKAAIVLATDGTPDNSCAGLSQGGLLNNIDNVALVAAGAANADPGVKTFVIGVGKELGQLDLIADAGGTHKAILVDVTGNADVQFLAALTQIRRDALDCSFSVPKIMGVDPRKARVRFVPDDGSPPVDAPELVNAAACMTGEGWYFDDPNNPTKLTLCDATCNAVTRGKTGQLYIEFACRID